jgi:flagellar protein FlaF
MSDREIEAAALTKAALLLYTCQQNWDAPDRPRRLAEALELNQKLWSIFEASVAERDHPLPLALRRDILGLGRFVDRRIFEVMAYPSPEKLTAIIQIDRNLAAGLRTGPSSAESRQPPEVDEVAARGEAVWA